MSRRLKRKIERVAQTAPTAQPKADPHSFIERNATFSALVTEWAGALLRPPATVTDAQATRTGDFVGLVWNVASGATSVDEAVAAIVASTPSVDLGLGSANVAETRAFVRALVVSRRAHFVAEARLVEAVLLQPLGGRRLFLVLPVGWEVGLT